MDGGPGTDFPAIDREKQAVGYEFEERQNDEASGKKNHRDYGSGRAA
jgi:hypothetical protein